MHDRQHLFPCRQKKLLRQDGTFFRIPSKPDWKLASVRIADHTARQAGDFTPASRSARCDKRRLFRYVIEYPMNARPTVTPVVSKIFWVSVMVNALL